VDADAHGLDILSVYQYGSKGMRFTAEAEGLALGDRATWIGVKATEWASYVQYQSIAQLADISANLVAPPFRMDMDMDKLIPISEKDQKFVSTVLVVPSRPI
jgi:hypothetical protein